MFHSFVIVCNALNHVQTYNGYNNYVNGSFSECPLFSPQDNLIGTLLAIFGNVLVSISLCVQVCDRGSGYMQNHESMFVYAKCHRILVQ